MVETTIFSETTYFCDNCHDQLSIHETDEDNGCCDFCEQCFHEKDVIICEPYVGDSYDGESKHYHKPCHEKYCKDLAEIGEAMAKQAPIPPTPKGAGILGVF
jgi:hypothetical protein